MFRYFHFHSRPLIFQAMSESEHRNYRITMAQKGNRGKAVFHPCFYKNYKTVIHPGKKKGREIGLNW